MWRCAKDAPYYRRLIASLASSVRKIPQSVPSRSSKRSGSFRSTIPNCEEMRLTVYPEKPSDRRYHGAYLDQAKERERKPYDRRFYGEIKGNVPLEDKAMVESQGSIVDRTLEHPGYGDRAILLLRKMIRDGIAEVANGGTPKGVLREDMALVDLDIGVEEYANDKIPEGRAALLT